MRFREPYTIRDGRRVPTRPPRDMSEPAPPNTDRLLRLMRLMEEEAASTDEDEQP